MKKMGMSLLLASAALVSMGISCSRAPQEERRAVPAGASAADANVASQNQASAGDETSSPQKTDGGPSAGRFIGRDIDINSGDLRGIRPAQDAARGHVIYESELSKEVRRLGIPIPEDRRWKPAGRLSSGGIGVYYAYESVLSMVHGLMAVLDEADASDEERRDVLGRFMTALRMDKPREAGGQAIALRDEVSSRHGLDSRRPFSPSTTRQAPRQRSEQSQP